MARQKHEETSENLPVTTGHGDAPLLLEGREGSFRMVKQQLPIPPELLYYIGGKKGGLLASAFDMISREGGICFFDTEVVEDSEWQVKMKVKCRYYNAAGRRVEDSEIYQIDVKALYAHSRANYEKVDWYRSKAENEFETVEERKGYKGKTKTVVVTRPIGTVKDYDADSGLPVIHYKLPKWSELDLYQNMLHLKKTKMAKCITCAHRRLTQRATGIKQISAEEKDWDQGVAIPIYSFLPEAKSDGLQEVQDLYGPEGDEGVDLAGPPFDSGPARPQMAQPQAAREPPPVQQRQASQTQPDPKASGPSQLFEVIVRGAADPGDTYDLRGSLGQKLGMSWDGGSQSWRRAGLDAEAAQAFADKVWEIDDPAGGGCVYETKRVEVAILKVSKEAF